MHPLLEQHVRRHFNSGAPPPDLEPFIQGLDKALHELADETLLHEATHDTLTRLPNRTLLIDRIEHAIARGHRETDYRFAVLFVGLDRFKVINESIGHAAGDKLLIEFSRRLRHCVRPADTVARIGGDEFVLLLENVDDDGLADRIAHRVQAELGQPFSLNGMDVFVTSSIGIAMNRGPADLPQDLVRDADIAMQHAKKDGKARHKSYDANMHAAVVKQLHIETDLRKAIDRDEFEVHYQPIICIKTGVIESLEALVRWRHPEKGLIPPLDFIPVAEETGLIAPIERIVMARACRQVAQWNHRHGSLGLVSLSLNLSARRFVQHDLVDEILGLVAPSGMPCDLVKLEITETVLMNNREQAAGKLEELKRHNIRISIDDFGTGYSSLSYLHKFPIDMVKIDRSFVRMIDAAGESDEIVRTIVNLAHNLRMAVTAEGIETPAQLDRLRELGCEFGQGYYFSKPLEPAAVEQKLMQRSPARAAA